MIGIRIRDTEYNIIALFEPGVQDSEVLSLRYSKQLDGVGTASFSIKTQSEIRRYLNVNNIIEILDFGNDEKVLWVGWIRGHVVCHDKTDITLNEIKDALNNVILKSDGTVTNISDALDLVGIPYVLNQDDINFNGIDYRVGMSAYNLFEEIRKATDYNYDYDGRMVKYGRLGSDRQDIGFDNTITPSSCANNETGFIFIDSICSEQSVQYDEVTAHNSNGDFAVSGSGRIQVSIYSDADNANDLQSVADEYLSRGQAGRIITFDIPSINSCVVEVGDQVEVNIRSDDDSRRVDSEVFILKIETQQVGCSLITKLSVSETKVILRDEFNLINGINNKVKVLETR